MRVEVRFNDEVAVISLSGKFLAGSDGPFLRQKVADLIDAGARKLVIDFAEVPYIDSTGLGFLAGVRTTAQGAGVALVLAGVNPHVKKVLDSVQLSRFFQIVPDQAAAIAVLRQATGGAEGAGAPAAKETKGKKKVPESFQ